LKRTQKLWFWNKVLIVSNAWVVVECRTCKNLNLFWNQKKTNKFWFSNILKLKSQLSLSVQRSANVKWHLKKINILTFTTNSSLFVRHLVCIFKLFWLILTWCSLDWKRALVDFGSKWISEDFVCPLLLRPSWKCLRFKLPEDCRCSRQHWIKCCSSK